MGSDEYTEKVREIEECRRRVIKWVRQNHVKGEHRYLLWEVAGILTNYEEELGERVRLLQADASIPGHPDNPYSDYTQTREEM